MTMSIFHEERATKFMKGQVEHKTPWSTVPFEEFGKEECLDLWNYADGMGQFHGKKIRMYVIKVLARFIYWML